MAPGIWNSLEIANLVVKILTPLVIVGVGYIINKSIKKMEYSHWKSQKLLEKRLAIYDDLGPDLNDILCYFTFVGNWKELKPTDIMKMKRSVDKKIYLAAPLFPEAFFYACKEFQRLCFETNNDITKDLRLKTSTLERKQFTKVGWYPEWDQYFSPSELVTDPVSIKNAYREIMQIFASCLGINPDCSIPETGRIPVNFCFEGQADRKKVSVANPSKH